MASDIGWGILGTGGIAHAFVSDLQLTGHRVAAVGSRTQESADAFAAEHGIPTAHGSSLDLVDDPAVDVIYVATPHTAHAEGAMQALAAGKHVLVEKPFTLNSAQARQVVSLAESRGLIVLEAMWTRWLPHMVRVREIIAAGTLGEVRTVIADHNQSLPTDPSHRLQNPDLGGGALLDLGVYPVSFAYDVLGAPTKVLAISSPTPTGVDRQTAMLFEYAEGQQAVLHTALDTRGPNRASILGTKARIEIDETWYTPTTFTVFGAHDEVLEEWDSPVEGRGMQFQAAEMERLIAEGHGERDILPPAESVAVMETLDGIRRQIGLRYPGEV
ncbi:Gfo/Idh/MocA family protein [Galbitalea soli]|uniref:Gfo/Idh/MocA family oxidoreductase n=1 Tax=Galbitalea soli TaxID=1268042 RepID=A0A7C9PMW1_9MICO|nr:Gfo/Idh/MocA family oxidoreductase [Galbitalea soli]NEM91273.1 Gfo/Idh/MocA family oxidoreductase [Galbitalea soli]NYJ29962.1 putative dehydrogenase [Galbitalea soli]